MPAQHLLEHTQLSDAHPADRTELPDLRTSRLTAHPSHGPYNSLQYWTRTCSPLRVVRNFLLIYPARFFPSENLKNVVYRWTGMKVGRRVSVGLMAMFDIFFPHLITIGDNTIIGYNSVVLGHEYLIREWRTGPVVIGKNVMIGANVTVLPGVVIGDGAVISAMSLVNKDVPPNTVAGGVPVRYLGKVNTDEEGAS